MGFFHFRKKYSLGMANWTDHGPIPDNQTNSSSFSPFTAALGMTVTVIIITVNSIVLIVFLKTKSIRENRHHNLVICLSICDLTIGFSGLLASLRLLIPAWSGLYVPCFLSGIFVSVGVFMSLFQTFLISFHRFLIAIGSPWNDYLLKGKRKYVVYVVSWTMVMVLHSTIALISSGGKYKLCNIKVLFGKHVHAFLGGMGIAALFLLLTIIVLYGVTLNNVRKRYTRTFAWHFENGDVSPEKRLQVTEIGKKKIFESLKVVGIIISLLILLTGPFVIVLFLFALGLDPSHANIFIVTMLSALNSAINPFVYSWKIESLRRELKLLFKCHCLESC